MNVLNGTVAILVLNCVAHFYPVAHITAVTSLKQIDPEFESVSQSLKVPFYRMMVRVTVPVSFPAILDIAVYLFVNSLTTVSAVIFLYGADTKLAAIPSCIWTRPGLRLPRRPWQRLPAPLSDGRPTPATNGML